MDAGCETPSHPFRRRHCLLEDLMAKELLLSNLLTENRELELKLQALREAGVSTLRSAAASLVSHYKQQAQQQKVHHDQEKTALQMDIVEKEAHFNRSLENVHALQARLDDNQKNVFDLQKLLERMEEEKTALTVKRNLLEHKVRCKLSESHKSGSEAESLRRHKIEISTLGEKICHLENMIVTQSSRILCYLKQIKRLSAELSAQESAVESLTEKLNAAQAQNAELKYRVDFWSSQVPT